MHCQRRELARRRVDVGEVMTGVGEVATSGQSEAASLAGGRHEGGREVGSGEWKADAHIAAAVVPVGRVDADVDRSSVSANERIQPRTLGTPSRSTSMVSMRLRTPRSAWRWFIGTLASPRGGRRGSGRAGNALGCVALHRWRDVGVDLAGHVGARVVEALAGGIMGGLAGAGAPRPSGAGSTRQPDLVVRGGGGGGVSADDSGA
jgi:hypothetical protein